jgi:hypothetical protein
MKEKDHDLIADQASYVTFSCWVSGWKKGLSIFISGKKIKTRSPGIKNVLQLLANAEEGHIHRLYRRAVDTPGKSSVEPLDKLTEGQKNRLYGREK